MHGPGKEPWEVYVVKADACTLGRNAGPGTTTGDGCRTPQAAERSSASAGCGWTGTSRASAGVPFALVAFARVR